MYIYVYISPLAAAKRTALAKAALQVPFFLFSLLPSFSMHFFRV